MSVPVDLVLIDDQATIYPAELVRQEGSIAWLKTTAKAEHGTALCLQGSNLPQWLFGRVEAEWVHGLQVRVRGMTYAERRDYARVYGGITMLYQVVDAEDELVGTRWMSRGEAPGMHWHTPDPFMDFSGSGMRFHHIDTSAKGDQILLEFKVPGGEEWRRAVGVVVRVQEIPAEQIDDVPFEEGALVATHWVALRYSHIDDETVKALIAFADRIQSAALALV